jgi:hypothetical protein
MNRQQESANSTPRLIIMRQNISNIRFFLLQIFHPKWSNLGATAPLLQHLVPWQLRSNPRSMKFDLYQAFQFAWIWPQIYKMKILRHASTMIPWYACFKGQFPHINPLNKSRRRSSPIVFLLWVQNGMLLTIEVGNFALSTRLFLSCIFLWTPMCKQKSSHKKAQMFSSFSPTRR